MIQDIYGYDKQLKNAELAVKNARIPEYNKEKILEFKRHLVVRGLSKPRVLKYLEILKSVSLRINKDFCEITKEDIYKFVEEITQKGLFRMDKTGV